MYTHAQRRSDPEVQELRHRAGLWLKELREKRGLSQRQLADLVGAEYYTFISQLETGRGRIPPARYREWAEALGVAPAEFVRTLMKYYDPLTYRILFEGSPAEDLIRQPRTRRQLNLIDIFGLTFRRAEALVTICCPNSATNAIPDKTLHILSLASTSPERSLV